MWEHRREHGGEASASLTEFSLGRLYLDALDNPALAAVHIGRAVALGLPAALSEDARARLVEASARAGDLRAARAAAAQYHGLYPNGRHAPDVDRWISSAP